MDVDSKHPDSWMIAHDRFKAKVMGDGSTRKDEMVTQNHTASPTRQFSHYTPPTFKRHEVDICV